MYSRVAGLFGRRVPVAAIGLANARAFSSASGSSGYFAMRFIEGLLPHLMTGSIGVAIGINVATWRMGRQFDELTEQARENHAKAELLREQTEELLRAAQNVYETAAREARGPGF